jgi:hypothetical protein
MSKRAKRWRRCHGRVADAVFRGKRGPCTARGIESLVTELGHRANVASVHPHRLRQETGRRLVVSIDWVSQSMPHDRRRERVRVSPGIVIDNG